MKKVLTFVVLTLLTSSSTGYAQAANSVSNVPISELPVVNTSTLSTLDNPADAPQNLTKLAPQVALSVVTILCGGRLGSAWSVKVNLSSQQIQEGFNSYLITNHHVIADCTQSKQVTLVLSDKSRVPGTVLTWDENSDLAGILTATKIPSLLWQGALPIQGYWVGVIGSPLGYSGILTTGIISSVNNGTLIGSLTAPINPGNSGGPVFDRTGRVVGIATAKFINAEGFGIFNGAPLICRAIAYCPTGTNVWFGQTLGTEIFKANPFLINQNAVMAGKFTGEGELKGFLNCYTFPLITDEVISSANIKGTYWRITDITDAKVLDLYLMPIQKSNSTQVESTKTMYGVKASILPSNTRVYTYTLLNQVKDHVYECAVSIVAKDTVGEFTSALMTADISTADGKVVPEKAPTPVVIPEVIVKKNQQIENWSLSAQVSVKNQRVTANVSSSSSLKVNITSNSETICLVSGTDLVLLKVGRCAISASQEGNAEYLPADNRIFVLDVVNPKTITCTKGKTTKKVTGLNPKCPSGYKEK